MSLGEQQPEASFLWPRQAPLRQSRVYGYHSHPETGLSEKEQLLGNERTPASTGECRWWDLLFPVLPGFSLLFLFLSYSQPLGPLFPDTSSPSSTIHLQHFLLCTPRPPFFTSKAVKYANLTVREKWRHNASSSVTGSPAREWLNQK